MSGLQRMITLSDGRRFGVRVDLPTWQAIEYLAGQSGKTYARWCAEIVEATPDESNATGAIRAAAMDALMQAVVFGPERADQIASMENHELMTGSAAITDDQLAEYTSTGMVAGSCDFGGFTVIYGTDENAQDCIWIKNGLRDHMHFAFVVPGAK